MTPPPTPATPVLSQADLEQVKSKAALLDDHSPLDAPASGYTKLLSTNNGPSDTLDMWSRPHPSGVNEYLVIGKAPVRARVMYNVLMDDAYHTQWDAYCAELRQLENYPHPTTNTNTNTSHTLNYWVVKYPTPLRKRDYVYERIAQRPATATDKQDAKGDMYYFATQAVPSDKMPEVDRTIRVTDFKGCYCLRDATVDDLKPTCEFLYIALDDPKGFIPKPIVNFLSSKAIPAAMQLLYKACREYKPISVV